MLFEKQYILTQTVEVEVRSRTETRTDSEGNDYDVAVPYNYYICKVKLENFDLSHVPVYIMDEETLSLYAVYMACLLYTSRAMLNGKLQSVSEDIYDSFILREIAEQPEQFKMAIVIGLSLIHIYANI